MIANGEVDLGRVRERIEALYDDVDFIVEQYRKAYEGSGLDADEIWEEIICDSLGDMNAFASVEVLGEMNDEFLEALKEETRKSKKDARGPPRGAVGKASRVIPPYTRVQYSNYGWVRANNILNAGYWKNFTENFAQAVVGNYTFPKNKKGEYMIAVYDAYNDSGITDVVVFVSGSIERPNITKIVKIDLTDDADIETKRRNLYEAERRGIQQTTGELFIFYHKANFIGRFWNQRAGTQSVGNNHRLNTKRSRSETKINPIVEFDVNEEKGTITITYSNGEIVTESLNSGKASQDLGFVDFLNENIEERERSNREMLANLLESEDMSPSEKGFLTKYKNKISRIEANEDEIASMEAELKELRKAGKKDSSRAITLEGKIEARSKEIARDENMILNLESTNSIKRLLKREKDAAYAEGMLAGQMAQGRQDAAKLRKTEEKLAEQKHFKSYRTKQPAKYARCYSSP